MEEVGEKHTKTVLITIHKDNFEVDVVGDIPVVDLLDILKVLMEDLIDELDNHHSDSSKMH